MDTLKAELRDKKVRALRREGYITGNLFGREIDGSILVKMTEKDVYEILRNNEKGSRITLDVEGKKYDVLIKEIDYGLYAKQIMDIEFQALVSDEMVHSTAEIVLLNKEMVTQGVLEEITEEISYKALPANLVDKVVIDAGKLRVGDTIRVKDLEISKNPKISVITNPDTVIVSVVVSKIAAENSDKDEDKETE
ncbi:MAG: 50S ribosomal protein L25 [Eubacteriales bacterium]|nr:50S ribosomal protein L25 [Eubacteriales bacterium]